MPKSVEQIRKEYAEQGILSKIGTAAADIANIGGNAVGFGLPNRFAEWAMGAESGAADERTREARIRAGLAGDVTNVAGQVYSLVRGAGAAKSTIGAVRAAPTAVAVGKSAGPVQAAKFLLNKAGPGVVPAAAPLSKAALAKGAGLLGLIGLTVAGRPGDEEPVAARPAAAAARAAAATPEAEAVITPQDRQLAFVDTLLRGPVTLREAQAATSMLPAPAKAQTNKDKLYGATDELAQSIFASQVAGARELAATDPVGAKAIVEKATDEYYKRRIAILGVDPGKLELANLLNAEEE
jgi:hypothetical protein